VQDWFRDKQSKIRVRSTVEQVLHTYLPDSYGRAVFTEKCNSVFDTMINYAIQGLKWNN
jgi:type I restriction enzyme, R subunit